MLEAWPILFPLYVVRRSLRRFKINIGGRNYVTRVLPFHEGENTGRLRFAVHALRISLLSWTLAFCCGKSQAAPAILVDSIHAHNALQAPTEANAYVYHTVYGYRRAFDYLRAQGVTVDEVSSGLLTPELLAQYSLLFINLVSADLPPFQVSEISAVKQYIEAGGSLLLITDHTNAYYHAYKLWPLLAELGIEITTETAADRPPATLGPGNGWIAVTRFKPHPVTQGLRAVAFQTGGTVDERYAIATTSPQGWGDQWQHQPYGEGDANSPGAAPGFYGNWQQDSGERHGALGVIAAKEVGKGRIAIVADQNLFGDPFLNYADNYQLWLNAVAWLSGEAKLARAEPYRQWRAPRVLAYEEYSRAAFGVSAPEGFYHLFVALGRQMWLFAGDDLTQDADLLLFAHDDYQLSAEALAGAVRHLRAGRNIVILGPAQHAGERGLLAQLQTKLGQPEESRSEAGGYVVRISSWPNCGAVLVLPQNAPFRNSAIPAPERKPNPPQQLILDTVRQLLNAALAPAEEP